MDHSHDRNQQPLPQPPLPEAANWALFLDLDGTLVEFADDPAAVQVATELPATLAALREALGGALALVSGRSINDVDRLLGQRGGAVAGLHGLEWRGADGQRHAAVVDAEQWHMLRAGARELADRFPGIRVEVKPPCIALHCREAPRHEDALTAAAASLAAGIEGYEVQPGNRVQEIKPAGQNKGAAVATLLRESPFRGRVPVYVGDDLTDEHAFAVVNAAAGLSIRVGERSPSAASFTLHNVSAVQAWLQACVDAVHSTR